MILLSTSVEEPSQIPPRRAARPRRPCARIAAVAFLIALAVQGSGGRAFADVSPSARALARALFEDARSLMAEKKFAQACPKLAESMRLDPAAGTQLNLAFCHEGEGRTATAWAEYNDALTQARRDGRPEREQFASDKLRGLSAKLMLLAITLAPGADIPGLEVSLDGAIVGPAALGAASPVDPGAHTLAARAPGFVPWSVEVRVATGDGKRSVSVPPLVKAPSRQASDQPERPLAGTESTQTAAAAVHARTERRTWGLVLLGTGLASATIGAAFGVDAIAKWRDRNAECAHGCSYAGVQSSNDAATSAWVADFGIGAGLAALAAGAYLLATPRRTREHGSIPGSIEVRAIPIFTESEVGLGLWGVVQ